MRLKKVGIVTVGSAAALLAASPMAFATDGGHGDKGGHEGHGHGPVELNASKTCGFQGGNTETNGEATGLLAGVVAQVPVAGNNVANLANCSDFLNNNLNDNLSGNSIAIL